MAQIEAPCARANCCAKLSGSALIRKLMSPCRCSVTFLERCRARARKPMLSNSVRRACGSGAVYSTNSKPSVPIGLCSAFIVALTCLKEVRYSNAGCRQGPTAAEGLTASAPPPRPSGPGTARSGGRSGRNGKPISSALRSAGLGRDAATCHHAVRGQQHLRRDARPVADAIVHGPEIRTVAGAEQLLEAVDHEVHPLETVDAVVRAHHALQIEGDAVWLRAAYRIGCLAFR